MNLRIRPIIAGLRSYLPLGGKALSSCGTGGTDDAAYCYSVWLRYLALAGEKGLDTDPGTVAELGPGDSLGIGLAALIAGADTYCALDLVRHADTNRNLAVFDQLAYLFQNRMPIPDGTAFPKVRPVLADYGFPKNILHEQRLSRALDPARLARIRSALLAEDAAVIRYVVPWTDTLVLTRASVDMIFSQAVLEHIDDLDGTYAAMAAWLKPGGLMAHTIDFTSHGSAGNWYGHWQYSDFTWGLIRGRRAYLINREPLSTHLRLLGRHGFTISGLAKYAQASACRRGELARRFQHLTDDDLTTCGAFIQALKPG